MRVCVLIRFFSSYEKILHDKLILIWTEKTAILDGEGATGHREDHTPGFTSCVSDSNAYSSF